MPAFLTIFLDVILVTFFNVILNVFDIIKTEKDTRHYTKIGKSRHS